MRSFQSEGDFFDRWWTRFARLLPTSRVRPAVGRPRHDDRECLASIVYVFLSGVRWGDLPSEFPSAPLCRRRNADWKARGISTEISPDAVEKLAAAGRLGTGERLRGRHVCSGSNRDFEVGKTKVGKWCNIELFTDANGIPIGLATAGANVAESELIGPALQAFPDAVELPSRVPLIADNAYDSDPLRDKLAKAGFSLLYPHRQRRVKSSSNDGRRIRRYRRRWKIDRTFGCLHSFRRIIFRNEYHSYLFDCVVFRARLDLSLKVFKPVVRSTIMCRTLALLIILLFQPHLDAAPKLPDHRIPEDILRFFKQKNAISCWFGISRTGELFDDDYASMTRTPTVIGFKFKSFQPAEIESLPKVPAPFGLCLEGNAISTTMLASLAVQDKLTFLMLRGVECSDAELKSVGNIKSLSILGLAGASVSARGLAELRRLPNLRYLSLDGIRITKEGISELKMLNTLAGLSLRSTGIGDEAIKQLSVLSELKSLSLISTQISDLCLLDIKKFNQLEILSLAFTGVTDIGIEAILTLHHLKALDLTDTKISDSCLRKLASLDKLVSLSLGACAIGDKGIESLKSLDGLHHLSLASTNLTNKGMPAIAQLSNLRTLSLSNTAVTDVGLAEIVRMRNLQRLVLRMTRITNDSMIHVQKLDKIEFLDVCEAAISNEGLGRLKDSRTLKALILSSTHITDKGILDLQTMPGLRRIAIRNIRLPKGTIDRIKEVMPNCEIFLNDFD